MSEKTCTKCGETKELSLFIKKKANKSGFGAECKVCKNTAARNWHTREYGRVRHLNRVFGMTQEDYDKLLVGQGGVCAICYEEETIMRHGKVQSLSVDHCHTTGEIRGLLCNACNIMLGKAKDNIDTLYNAIKYLEVQL